MYKFVVSKEVSELVKLSQEEIIEIEEFQRREYENSKLESLLPSTKEIEQAEMDLRILETLMEAGLI